MKDELKKELNEEELKDVDGGIFYGCDPDGKHQPHPHPRRLNEEELDEVNGGANSNDFSRGGAIYNQRNENLDTSKRDLDREKDTLMDDLDRGIKRSPIK